RSRPTHRRCAIVWPEKHSSGGCNTRPTVKAIEVCLALGRLSVHWAVAGRSCWFTTPGGIFMSSVKRREFITLLSGAAAWPLAVQAQQPASMKRIAVVHPIVSPEIMNEKSVQPFYRGLFTELRRLGYVEGNKLVVERRSGEGRTERYGEIARELVNLKPDVM